MGTKLSKNDEELLAMACQVPFCFNFSETGYVYCTLHLHGAPQPMPERLREVKYARDKSKFNERGDHEPRR